MIILIKPGLPSVYIPEEAIKERNTDSLEVTCYVTGYVKGQRVVQNGHEGVIPIFYGSIHGTDIGVLDPGDLSEPDKTSVIGNIKIPISDYIVMTVKETSVIAQVITKFINSSDGDLRTACKEVMAMISEQLSPIKVASSSIIRP